MSRTSTSFNASDRPKSRDRRMLREARDRTVSRVEEAEATLAAVRLAAFREEVGATVRSVSPFLLALLASAGLQIDDVMERIAPTAGWPRRPRLSHVLGTARWATFHALRCRAAALRGGDPAGSRRWSGEQGVDLAVSGCVKARLFLVGHSIEITAIIGGVGFETRFGVMRMEFEDVLPETLQSALVGRPIGAIVDHVALRARNWPVLLAEPRGAPFFGSALVVDTGTEPYRMPWVR